MIQLLDERHQWPSLYPFKFIVPEAKGKELKAVFPEAHKIETRASSSGRYTSFTFHCSMGSGREVLDTYARVHALHIPGLISL